MRRRGQSVIFIFKSNSVHTFKHVKYQQAHCLLSLFFFPLRRDARWSALTNQVRLRLEQAVLSQQRAAWSPRCCCKVLYIVEKSHNSPSRPQAASFEPRLSPHFALVSKIGSENALKHGSEIQYTTLTAVCQTPPPLFFFSSFCLLSKCIQNPGFDWFSYFGSLKKKSETESTASVLKKRSKTHKRLKKTLFNWTCFVLDLISDLLKKNDFRVPA